MKSYDVAIIGGGIVGITLAFFLSRLGQRVIVLEQGSLATQTTANSFAWINASSKAVQVHYHQLNVRESAGYNQLSQEFGEETLGLNPCGQLYVVRTKDDTRHHDLRLRWQLLREKNYPTA